MKCKLCGHEWESRIEDPKACPKCKRYDYREEIAVGFDSIKEMTVGQVKELSRQNGGNE